MDRQLIYTLNQSLNANPPALNQPLGGYDGLGAPSQELLAKANVTPYDAFAIWMHLTRAVHLGKAAPGMLGVCGAAASSFAGDLKAEWLA